MDNTVELTPEFVFNVLMKAIFRKSSARFYNEVIEACKIPQTEFRRCMYCQKPIMEAYRFCNQNGYIVSEDLHFLSVCEYKFFLEHKDILMDNITS